MLFVAMLASLLYVSGAVALLRRVKPKYNKQIAALIVDSEAQETLDPNLSSAPDIASSAVRSGWFAAGLIVLVIALIVLECLRPFYFAQDDVHRGELANMVFACRTLWLGHLPQYDPYVLMGTPLANLGYTSLTYPPTYLSYAIARYMLHNDYALADVFAFLHILCGYAATYILSRRLNIGSMPATLAALSFVLSGSILMVGRSTHTFITLALYLPLIMLSALTLVQQPLSWRSTLCASLPIVLFFQVGFSQIWIYAVALFCLLLPLFCMQEGRPLRASLKAIPALLIGIGFSAPLALQQFLITRNVTRTHGNGNGIIHGLFAMLLPYPLVKASHPDDFGSATRDKMGCLYFFGGLFAFLLIVHAVLLLSSRPTRALWRSQAIFICAAVIFTFAAANPGPWSLLVKIPVIGKINNYPFRLLPFFVLCAVLCGSRLLDRLLKLVTLPTLHKRWQVSVFSVSVAVLLYFVQLAPPAFSTFDHAPYASMPTPIRQALLGTKSADRERAYSWTLWWTDLKCDLALNWNMASIYELPVFNGYDPIIEGSPAYESARKRLAREPLAAARAYGLEWHLSANLDKARTIGYFEGQQPPFLDQLSIVASAGGVDVRRLANVDPLAFPLSDRTKNLPIAMHGEGLDVDVRSLMDGGSVIVNFLWYRDMKARVDGALVPCLSDSWGRMRVEVPAGASRLAIRYEPPWARGVLLGIVFVLLGIASAAAIGKRV